MRGDLAPQPALSCAARASIHALAPPQCGRAAAPIV